ncbi:MAG: tyrosine-type recombinase/integrase [Pseudobdellovibrionaceae bacterium]
MENNQDKKPKKILSRHDTVKNKKDECIYEMANGRYMVVVQKRINGKVRTKKKRNIKLIQEARQERKRFTYELNQEDMKHRDGQYKWDVAYEKYLALIRQRITDSQSNEKPLGEGIYETAKAAYNYTKHWHDLFFTQISSQHVYAMMNMPAFKELKYAVKKQYMRHIRLAFKFSFGPSANIYLNPAHNIYVQRTKDEETRTVLWIRPEIMEKIFALYHDENMNPKNKWASLFYFAFYTGMRSGEIFSLAAKDVHLDDPKNCYVEVKTTYNWKTEKITPTKSGQKRFVDVTAIRPYLLAHRLRTQSVEKEFFFPRDREWKSGKAAQAVRAALKEVGYKPETNTKGEELWPNFHSIRAAYIMQCLISGIPHLTVQQLVGHADYATLKSYTAKLKADDIKGVSYMLKPMLENKKTG